MVGGAPVLVEGVTLVLMGGVALGIVVGVAHVLVGVSDGSAVVMGGDVTWYLTCDPACTGNWALTFRVF